MAYIQFLGAAGTVTGSKHLINTGDAAGNSGFQALVDCGLFQGPKEWRERNWQNLPIAANRIDAVILTHAHLDHCGWIPRLVKDGFRGAIYATQPTIDLCGIILPDSGHLQEEDARFYNKMKKSKHDPALPLYTFEEAQKSLEQFKPVGVGETVELSAEISFRFVRAAHILGSCMAEVLLKTDRLARKLLFTGDIGRVRDHKIAPGKVVHSGPEEGETADLARDGVDLRQSDASEGRSSARIGAVDHCYRQSRRQHCCSGIRDREDTEICLHPEASDRVGADSAHPRILRQSDGDQGCGDFPEA